MKLNLNYLFIFLLTIFINCNDNGKWNLNNTNPPKFDIPNQVIYFQDSIHGIFGGYGLTENTNSKNLDKIDMFPIIYKTNSLGKDFEKINMPKNLLGNVNNLYLENSTIIAQIDNSIFKTDNSGKTWNKIIENEIQIHNTIFFNKDNFRTIIEDNRFVNNNKGLIESNKNYKFNYLLQIENNKIDTLKILDGNKKYQLTKSNLYFWEDDKISHKTNVLSLSDLNSQIVDSIQFKNPESIKYVFELENKKSLIITENSLIQYFSKKQNYLYPKFLEKYYIKEFLSNKNVQIAICKEKVNKNSLTNDFYFISYDYGINWKFLQTENGSNRIKFLYDNKMLISFDRGLQYLKL